MRADFSTATIEQTASAITHLAANTDCRVDPHAAGAACLVTGPTHQVAAICEESAVPFRVDPISIPPAWEDAINFCVQVCSMPLTDAVITVERALQHDCPSIDAFIDQF